MAGTDALLTLSTVGSCIALGALAVVLGTGSTIHTPDTALLSCRDSERGMSTNEKQAISDRHVT